MQEYLLHRVFVRELRFIPRAQMKGLRRASANRPDFLLPKLVTDNHALFFAKRASHCENRAHYPDWLSRRDTNDAKSRARDILTILMRFRLATITGYVSPKSTGGFRCAMRICAREPTSIKKPIIGIPLGSVAHPFSTPDLSSFILQA